MLPFLYFNGKFLPLQVKNNFPTDFVFKKFAQSFTCLIIYIHNLIQHFKHSMHSCTIKQYGKMKISFHNYFFNWTENCSRLLRFSHCKIFSMAREFDGEFVFNKQHFNHSAGKFIRWILFFLWKNFNKNIWERRKLHDANWN